MSILKRIFDFYLQSSIHVALSVVALAGSTQLLYKIPFDANLFWFLFCSAVAGYNFVKYHTLLVSKIEVAPLRMKFIASMSFALLAIAAVFFFMLSLNTQIATLIIGAFTILYAIPFFPGKQNARSWSGAKIYIVALCWAGVTVLLPILEAGADVTRSVMILFLQRFILIIVLLLIFDIVDLRSDHPSLRTMPQRFGVPGTKKMGYALLFVLFIVEFLKPDINLMRIASLALFCIATSAFLKCAHEQRSKYYTLFWVESIPILWFFLMILSEL